MTNVNELFFDTRGRSECPFQVYIGGRGIGKTYSSLRNTIFEADMTRKIPEPYNKFMYMRRIAKDIELCASEISNPFKRINRDCGSNVYAEFQRKDGYAVFKDDIINVDGEDLPAYLGYGAALSTFSGLRGVDFSDVTTIVFDEFIAERHVRRIKDEGKVFLNMYETVNRNRELQGEPPVKVLLLANSISLASGILLEIGAVPIIASMIEKGQSRATVKERGLYIELVDSSKVAELKNETALYKLTKGTDFSREAIMNQFTQDNLDLAKKVRINEYKPIFNFCDFTYYKHKSRDEYYIAKRKDKAPVKFGSGDVDRLQTAFKWMYNNLVVSRKVFFDDYATKLVFDNILE